MPSRQTAARGRGRPPKFTTPSRVITLTLPERTLADLELLGEDRAMAIVRATELALGARGTPGGAVEVHQVSNDSAVITVPYSPRLAEIEGVTLIEFLPSRYLVILKPGKLLAEVEIGVIDALEALDEAATDDRVVLRRLLDYMRALRRSSTARLASVILVDTERAPAP